MSTLQLKAELQQMIEQEFDLEILNAVRLILQKERNDPILQQKLTIRALKSEADIKAGRVFTVEEVLKRTQRQWMKLR